MVGETGIQLEPHETRRNILTRGVDVPGLVGPSIPGRGCDLLRGQGVQSLQPPGVDDLSRRPRAACPGAAACGPTCSPEGTSVSATASPSSPTDRPGSMTAGPSRRAPRDGLFEPGSISWRVDRESVVLAGGTCALLMQIAHPAVAAGVDAHSDFRSDPFARLRRTLGASWAIVFGDRPPRNERSGASTPSTSSSPGSCPRPAARTGPSTPLCCCGSTPPWSTPRCACTTASSPRSAEPR